MIVLLETGTIGSSPEATVGLPATVTFHDENGLPTTETGIVAEILEDWS
jgi:hypothetical protein